jgi:type II secretory pathway component PulC
MRPPPRALTAMAICCLAAASPGLVSAGPRQATKAGGSEATGQAGAVLSRTALPIALVGTMVDSVEPSRSACLVRCIQSPERKYASVLQVGETACDLAEIKEIRQDAVVLRNLAADRIELLPLPGTSASKGVSASGAEPAAEPVVVNESPGRVSVEVPKASVDHYLVNLSELLSSAQAMPRFRDTANGQRVIEGFELTQVRAGSVVEQVGLKNGDVIVDVNGEPLDGLPTVLRLFGQAPTMGQATVTVLRGSQRMTFVFNTK